MKLDRMELIDLTYEVIDEIKQSDLYQAFIIASREYNRFELLPLKENYRLSKLKFEETSVYGKYHPDYTKSRLAYTEAKTILFQTQAYQAYQDALMKLNFKLRDISYAITNIIQACLISSNEPHACHTKG